jgi:hypothetical protein
VRRIPRELTFSLNISQDYLDAQAPLDSSLLVRILSNHIKPLFASTPHPMVNLESGRKLPRPAGGANSAADMYDHQAWKTNLGIANILRYCIESMEVSELEQRWPLLVPPIMTISDDREAKWRMRILPCISSLIEKAPADLLRRTGLQDLLQEVSITKGPLVDPALVDFYYSVSEQDLAIHEQSRKRRAYQKSDPDNTSFNLQD